METYKYGFPTPVRCIMSAATTIGKTYRLFHILKYADVIFDNPKQFKTVFYYYSIWNDKFDHFKDLVTEFIEGKPTEEEVLNKLKPYKNSGGATVVLDDFMTEIDKTIADIFTRISHHCNASVFILWQNFFPSGNSGSGFGKTIRQCCTDLIVFKNVVDKTQFTNFAKQFKPGKVALLRDIYEYATREQYSYLWIDLRTSSNDQLRLMTNVVPDEWPLELFIIE